MMLGSDGLVETSTNSVSTPGDRHTGTVSPHLCYVVPAVCSWSLWDSVIGDGVFAFCVGELWSLLRL